MKKLLVTLLALMLVMGTAFAVSAATASPVKSYDSAAMGDLLYTVNFKGDDAFKPKRLGDIDNMNYTVSEDGSSLTIKGKGTDKTRNYWGGKIEGLSVTESTYYTMTYKVNAKASANGNNSIGVGGVYLADTGLDGKNEPIFYCNYARHNAVGATEYRSSLSDPDKIATDYVMWKNLAKKEPLTDADGYITMALSFHGPTKKFMSYYVAKDGTTQLIETQNFTFDKDTTMGFAAYAYYAVVNTTVKDAKIYKGAIGDVIKAPASSTAATTKAPETTKATATTTKAPETTKAAATATIVEEQGGCGSSVAITGIALVAAVGTSAAVSCKKRKDD